MNILEKADQIVNHRSEEKERQYGPFNDCMDDMRNIFNAMTGLNLSTKNMFQAMIAMKLAREKHSHREDNLLDSAAYIGAMNNYLERANSGEYGCNINDFTNSIDKHKSKIFENPLNLSNEEKQKAEVKHVILDEKDGIHVPPKDVGQRLRDIETRANEILGYDLSIQPTKEVKSTLQKLNVCIKKVLDKIQ